MVSVWSNGQTFFGKFPEVQGCPQQVLPALLHNRDAFEVRSLLKGYWQL
jgi:hypothetical protein